MLGTAEIRILVYGCSGAESTCLASPASTIRPVCITATRSAISATTPKSWVMNSTPVPRSRCSSLISRRICAWVVTSSAVVGSSAISSPGCSTSAIAIMIRWRWPPESWWG